MLGMTEVLIIIGVASLLFGANKLPEIARSLGSFMGEFQKAKMETERQVKAIEEQTKTQPSEKV